MKFTFEWEVDSCIPFLDVLIKNCKDFLKFTVYRKPTNAESYLHYFSYSPINIKIGLAQGLFLRALRVCDPEFLDSEIKHIKASLKKLAYPDKILTKAYFKARTSHFGAVKVNINKPEVKKNIVVPYSPVLEPFKQTLRVINRGLVFKYNNKLSSTITKNRPESDIECGVYKIPCKDCPKSYIGETGRDLSARFREHKSDIQIQKKDSGVATHVMDTNHSFDFENAEIIWPSMPNNISKRHIVESAVICQLKPSDLCTNLNSGFSPHNQLISKYVTSLLNVNLFS